ncbi:MAG: hypothetical protein PHW04_02400 [Candidatus Wallbacteria bacterium]|nr:hypothetical protein [Candidatus Wallbacteria bacterium]
MDQKGNILAKTLFFCHNQKHGIPDQDQAESLRVGEFRILFEIHGAEIIVYRIKNRKDAYQ